jgi:hypothetical protein
MRIIFGISALTFLILGGILLFRFHQLTKPPAPLPGRQEEQIISSDVQSGETTSPTETEVTESQESSPNSKADENKEVKATITGGYETDPRDGGRPVVLIASMLSVEDQVFRDAFSRVTPAQGGEPTQEQVQKNKQALLDALSPYGVSNDELDTVSNYYRYRPQNGEVWQHNAASVYATVEKGKVTGFVIKNHGSGYASPPTITVEVNGKTYTGIAKLEYTQSFTTNGRIVSVKLK